MSRRYSGWNPSVRSRVEQLIVEAVSSNGGLTVTEIRLYLKRHPRLPRQKPITQMIIAQFCRSLRNKGILSKAGKRNRQTVWAFAVNWHYPITVEA